jgi:hypothetical protein
LLLVLKNAKLINDTNYTTYIVKIGDKERLTESAIPLVRNIFFAMIFDERHIIEYAKINPNIKVERIFGNLIEIKAFEGIFNIIPQLKSAIEKIALLQSTTETKIDAEDVYSTMPIFEEERTKYIEYLCIKLIELEDKKQQQNVLSNYIKLVKNLRDGLWKPANQSEITPEKLLEMSFDEAKVKNRLDNLGDKKRQFPQKKVIRLQDKKSHTLGEKIVAWIKNDWNKKYRWE